MKHIKLTEKEFSHYINYDQIFVEPPTQGDFTPNRRINNSVLFQELYLRKLGKKYDFDNRTNYVGRNGVIYKIKNPSQTDLVSKILSSR